MNHIHSSPATVISLIRTNLKDRYESGFPVLKELIQNADDAGAKKLHLGWAAGKPAPGGHPLLSGPALFAVNDGPFDKQNAWAIYEVGLSSKSSDAATIGKFGLGMKSVFHFSEAVYYLAKCDRLEGGEAAGQLNPWCAPGMRVPPLRQGWDQFGSEHRHWLCERLGELLPTPQYFLLWMPLRLELHHDRQNPPLIVANFDNYRGTVGDRDDKIFVPGHVKQTADLLPMLHDLETVEVWRLDRDRTARRVSSVRLGTDSVSRCLRPDRMKPGQCASLRGEVTAEADGPTIHVFGGLTRLLDTPAVRTLSESEYWPSGLRVEDESFVSEKEKAPPHVGVCWCRRPSDGTARLDCSWAVYLPLSDEVEQVDLEGTWSYSLLLHGWFFVDSGRKLFRLAGELESRPADELSLRREWNRELVNARTLPLIPQSLLEIQKRAGMSAEQVRQLVSGLAKTNLFAKNRAAICSAKQLGFRWRPGGASWELIEAEATLTEITESPGGLNPADALPGLEEMAERLVLTPRGWPRLANQERGSAWPEQELAGVLASAEPEQLVADARHLEYVVEFCELTRPKLGPVTALLRRLLAQPLKDLGNRAELVARLVKRVPANQRLAVPVKDDPAGRELWRRLDGLPLTVLLVPQVCEPADDIGSAMLPPGDAASILRSIALAHDEQATAAAEELRNQIAQLVLEATVPTRRRDLLDQCADLRLFRVYEAGDEKEQAALLRWADLDARWKQGWLFKRQATLRSGAFALRKAVPRELVTLASDMLGDLLFGPNKVPACDAESCGRVILRQGDPSALAEVARRGDLLEFFLKSPPPADVSSFRRAVATVLHGRVPTPIGQPELLVNGGASEPIWARITNDVLTRQGESWRLVDHGLSCRVPENRRQEFALSAVDRISVVRLLEEQVGREGPDGVSLSLTDTQREELMGALCLADKFSLLKRLRIHAEYVNEQPNENDPQHAITDRCYWYDGFALPPELRSHVTLLRLSDNATLRAAQRQRLAPVWDARAAAEVVLARLKPADHWRILLGALGGSRDWPPELLSKLQNAAWLPRADGGAAVCPCDVIYLEPIRETVSRALAAAASKAFVDYQELDGQVCKAENLAALAKRLFPPERPALEMLGEVLGEDDAFHVGRPEGLTQSAGLSRFRTVFANASDGVMPAAAVVAEVVRKFTWDECVNGLLKPLRKPLSAQRLKQILAFLSRRHEENQGSSENRAQVQEVYGWYLHELATHGQQFRDALTGTAPLRLLSRAGRWKMAAELCLGAENIEADYRLDDKQRDIIEVHLPASAKDAPSATIATSTRARTDDCDAAAEELKAYFKPWLEYRPGLQVVIGGFLAILGGNPAIKQLSQQYLGNNYKVANVRQRLRLPKDQYGRTSEAQVDQYQVTVQREKGQLVAVNNLCGQRITVPLSKEVEDLFVYYSPAAPFERRFLAEGEWKSYRVVRLREFAPATIGDHRLINLLRKAAGKIVAEFYNQSLGTGLDDLFKGLKEDDIHQIRVAETYLLDHAPASLRQFDLSSQPCLRDLLRRMDEVHRLQAEENVAAAEGAVIERRSDEQRRQVQQDFREALNDPAVCSVLLDAVRRKIKGHYQYSESSVPFEILQNADDACIEFEQLGAIPGDWFSIACTEESVAFLHAGRPINVAGPGDVTLADSGFHRDLEKMLMLSTSDKQTGAETSTVTGKFGLGYKSVFLISDTPRALSRGLGFAVVGALLPCPLAVEDRQQLAGLYKSVTGREIRDAQGTILSQPLRTEANPEMILSRFRRLLPVLLAFTQRIRKCHVHGLFPEPKTTEWSEQGLPHAAGWAVGLLDSPDPDSLLTRRQAAVMRLGDKKALLLGLDPHGFVALPDEIPSLWVTAPTGHHEKVGVAINAPFALDVGRAQLARDNAEHHGQADELGFLIGAALERLFDAANDHWDDVRRALGLLDGDRSRMALWRSLWLLLADRMANRARHSDSEAFRLVQQIFWGERNYGLARLYEQKLALPSGLSGDHDVLTKRSLITKRLTGYLDGEDGDEVFKLAAAWPRVRSQLPPGSVVSGSRIWAALVVLGAVDERQASSADLSHFLDWELKADAVVTPGRAETFGPVVTPDALQRLENSPVGRPEAERIRAVLKSAHFRSRAGTESLAERLLVATTTNSDRLDETRRAAFAPADRVLADDYQGTGIDFFIACRPALKATVDDLIAWGRAAKGKQRAKFLEYLNSGDLSSTLSRALRQQTGENDWWRKAEEFQKAAGSTHGIDEGFVSAVVGHTQSLQNPPTGEPDRSPVLDPAEVLPRLAEWWRDNRAVWMRRYRDWVYPAFLHPVLTSQHTLTLSMDDLSTGTHGRKQWLSLFILGMTHGLGRGGRQAQQHRGFLELCEREKWLDVFADPKVNERRADWIALVDSYLDKQQGDPEYYNWLRQLFISIRAVAVRLEDYAEAFRALRGKGPVRLGDVLRPRNSPSFQGGGVDPPSLARVLSLGACFVSRELVRSGFIPSERTQVHRFCYPPVRSVRQLLGSLAGCPNLEGDHPDSWARSEFIFDFLSRYISDPTFGGDFDIPLWLVSRRPDLQEVVLGDAEPLPFEAAEDWE